MNEQLCQSIAKQAAHSLSTDDLIPYNYDLYIKKIMKLVVQECADFLKDTLDDHFAAEQLKEHFGDE
jgi:hypothetical protein